MKQIPLIFSHQMSGQIIAGNKDVTRRLKGLKKINENPDDWQFEWADYCLDKPYRFTKKSSINNETLKDKSFEQEAIKCPFGQPGDLIICKEKFQVIGWDWEDSFVKIKYSDFSISTRKYPKDTEENEEKWSSWLNNIGLKYIDIPGAKFHDIDGNQMTREEYINDNDEGNAIDLTEAEIPWKPSIFMPLWCSRIRRKIISITPVRLQDITEEDAIREGIEKEIDKLTGEVFYCFYPCKDIRDDTYIQSAKTSFYSLWKHINGPGSWERNPWVWRIEFEKQEGGQHDQD